MVHDPLKTKNEKEVEVNRTAILLMRKNIKELIGLNDLYINMFDGFQKQMDLTNVRIDFLVNRINELEEELDKDK